jgi:hypothetical protein
MCEGMPSAIFVSYSHQDTGLVKPVVELLRVIKDLVFQDLDGIKPGRKWRREIDEALYAAHLLVLFWCYHSSRSTEVRREYEVALMTGKDVLPVLLDTTRGASTMRAKFQVAPLNMLKLIALARLSHVDSRSDSGTVLQGVR